MQLLKVRWRIALLHAACVVASNVGAVCPPEHVVTRRGGGFARPLYTMYLYLVYSYCVTAWRGE